MEHSHVGNHGKVAARLSRCRLWKGNGGGVQVVRSKEPLRFVLSLTHE